jgi:3',5'-cyclic AMP phosphodiesterase CpdA
MKISKRLTGFILIMLVFVLIGCTKSTAALRIKSDKDITFFIATDVHYLADSLTDKGEAYQKFISGGDGRQLNYISEIVDAFSYDIKKKKADVLIVSGDLTTNGEKESHQEFAKKLKKIEDSGTSVFVTPGNHDISNPFARSFKDGNQYIAEYINEKDFEKIYKDFGYGEAVLKDKNTLSYLAAPSEDVWILMLDTALYNDNIRKRQPRLDGQVNEGTLEWIKKCSILAKKNNAQLIAVMHHNLIDHSEVIKEGYTINNSKDVLDLFQSLDIKLALSGHTHIQDIKSYSKDNYKVYDIVTSALVVYPQKYGVLKYSSKEGYDYSTSSVDIESWAKDNKLAEKNLMEFKKYSEEYFKNNIFNSSYQRYLMDDSNTIEEAKLMAETSAIIRTKYQANSSKLDKEEFINSEGYKLLVKSGMQKSIMRMLDNDVTSINRLRISVP